MRTRLVNILSGVVFLTLMGCASVAPVNEIPQAIANAKTAADHLLIADYFAQKAANFEAESKLHEKMSQSYRRNTVRSESSASMSAHCRELERQLNAAAKEAKALEQAHRDIGASLK